MQAARFVFEEIVRVTRVSLSLPLVAALALAIIAPASAAAAQDDPVKRGEYLLKAGGCITCHTAKDGTPLAGGRPFKTPFGTFYSPNITPDNETGIGRWSDEQFYRALHDGERPDGTHYFPVFPYPTYTRMTRADAVAIKAYLFSRPAAKQANRPHSLPPVVGWRVLQSGWKFLYFTPTEFKADPAQPTAINRGAYLVTALAHCGECHTPRNAFGALDLTRALAGTTDGPGGERVPNITPDAETGIGQWSEGDIVQVLKTGLKPDYDAVGGSMGEAVNDGLQHLTDDDLKAIAAYLKTVPAVKNAVKAAPKK